jgi:predicted alpha/beta hydrolase family esterase
MNIADWGFALKNVLNSDARRRQKEWAAYFDELEKWEKPTDKLDHRNKSTILLVPWITRSDTVMAVFGNQIAEVMNVAYAGIDYQKWCHPRWLEHISGLIQQKVIELWRKNPIYLLWHSTGGCPAIITALNNSQLTHVYQAATPNNGTPFYHHPSVRELAAAKNMNMWPYRQRKGRDTKVISFIAENDQLVSPNSQSSKHTPMKSDDKEDILLSDVDHYTIITDPLSIMKMIAKIQKS